MSCTRVAPVDHMRYIDNYSGSLYKRSTIDSIQYIINCSESTYTRGLILEYILLYTLYSI